MTAAAKPNGEDAVVKTLASRGELTGAEIAAATGLGRSTVARTLAALERAGMARREPGGREGRRRLPDRWSADPTDERSEAGSSTRRLSPGQLDGLVLDFVNAQGEGAAAGATAVAKALGRSTGAVANCLARLAAAGKVRQVSERPRRWSATPASSKRGRSRRSRKEES